MKIKDIYKHIKPLQFYVVHMWMMTELKLTGIQLHTYAVIYGYSQSDFGSFNGDLNYLSEITSYSRQRICSALKELTNKGLILKYNHIINGQNKPSYKCNSEYIPFTKCEWTINKM